MAENIDKLSRFEEAVDMEVGAEIENLLEDAKNQAESLITIADDEYLEHSFNKVSGGTKQIKRKMEHLVSQSSFNAEREVVAYRNKLVDDFFSKIQNKLVDFTATGKYSAFIKKTLEDLNKEKPFYSGVTVFVKPSDEENLKKIAGAFSALEVKTDKTIKLGGATVFYPKESQYIDKTLDDAFRQQKEKFVNNPEMQL